MKYEGKKFRPTGSKVKYDIWHKPYEVQEFVPTKAYCDWLKEQQALKDAEELRVLKQKLDYEYKTYGECDSVELDRYLSLVKASY